MHRLSIAETDITTAEVKENPSPLAPDFWALRGCDSMERRARRWSGSTFPPRTEADGNVPGNVRVLFAFHGAGGSENMFFETYGAGRLVELAAARGWIVVAPRQSLMGGIGLTAEQQLEVLSAHFSH